MSRKIIIEGYTPEQILALADDQLEAFVLCGELDCQLSGYCPVQGTGTVAGRPFYFRARHDEWTFAISETPELEPEDIYSSETGFYRESNYGKPGGYDASWMPLDEVEALIRRCAVEYKNTKKS